MIEGGGKLVKHSFTICAVLSIFALGAAASEKKVRMQDLPPAVQATVKAQTQGATLLALNMEVENGKTEYEAETKVNGHGRDIQIDPTGKIVAIEEEVPFESIPAAAKSGLTKLAAGGKIKKIESVTKGKTVTYEAVVTKDGKSSEIVVSANGSPSK